MVSSPAVTSSLMRCFPPARSGKTSVSGPGQNFSASASAASPKAIARSRAASSIRYMYDQRIEARPPFRLENARDGLPVGGVGAEPVHRLGWKRHEPARPHDARRFRDWLSDHPKRRL